MKKIFIYLLLFFIPIITVNAETESKTHVETITNDITIKMIEKDIATDFFKTEYVKMYQIKANDNIFRRTIDKIEIVLSDDKIWDVTEYYNTKNDDNIELLIDYKSFKDKIDQLGNNPIKSITIYDYDYREPDNYVSEFACFCLAGMVALIMVIYIYRLILL